MIPSGGQRRGATDLLLSANDGCRTHFTWLTTKPPYRLRPSACVHPRSLSYSPAGRDSTAAGPDVSNVRCTGRPTGTRTRIRTSITCSRGMRLTVRRSWCELQLQLLEFVGTDLEFAAGAGIEPTYTWLRTRLPSQQSVPQYSVPPGRIELPPQAPQAYVLSTGLRGHVVPQPRSCGVAVGTHEVALSHLFEDSLHASQGLAAAKLEQLICAFAMIELHHVVRVRHTALVTRALLQRTNELSQPILLILRLLLVVLRVLAVMVGYVPSLTDQTDTAATIAPAAVDWELRECLVFTTLGARLGTPGRSRTRASGSEDRRSLR